MTRLLKKQVGGRRKDDTEPIRWQWDVGKLILIPTMGALIAWLTWTTVCNFKAIENEKRLNKQIEILHNRITDEQKERIAFDQNLMKEMLQLQRKER